MLTIRLSIIRNQAFGNDRRKPFDILQVLGRRKNPQSSSPVRHSKSPLSEPRDTLGSRKLDIHGRKDLEPQAVHQTDLASYIPCKLAYFSRRFPGLFAD